MSMTQNQFDTFNQVSGATGAELHLNALKDSFKQAANSLAQFYKQSSHSYNVAY